MKDNKSPEARRKILKSITLGAGAIGSATALPKKWTNPVVSSVILPAHAATTTCGNNECRVAVDITGSGSGESNFVGTVFASEECPGGTCTSEASYDIPSTGTDTWEGTFTLTQKCTGEEDRIEPNATIKIVYTNPNYDITIVDPSGGEGSGAEIEDTPLPFTFAGCEAV